MKRAAQLEREIATVLATPAPEVRIPVKKLYGWEPKVDQTIVDVREGRLSYNKGKPVRVSKLDTPRGAYFIVDGHHRVVEAVLDGDATIAVELDMHVPRIERAGGAYQQMTDGKVNVLDHVRAGKRAA